MDNEFRKLPSVEAVASDKGLQDYYRVFPRDVVVGAVRKFIAEFKKDIQEGKSAPDRDYIVIKVSEYLSILGSPGPRRVINATGIILHTNLGRAPLSGETIAAMERVSLGYSDLEFNLENGTRGSRQVHIENLLCQVTGAEAGLVVNNNAAAVLLALTALAKRKEVIVSRGQAVEIGGGFRIPDVMRQSGAKLVEVGTTNITNLDDYEQAINSRTVGLLRVHSSNFKIIGFTGEVSLPEMVALAKQKGLMVFDDLGSGCLIDTSVFGLAPEPVVQESVAAGANLIFFSGDKLLGGPQAGVIIGDKILVDKLKKHPLARAVRIDKNRLAGFAATLLHYLKGEALEKIPVWRMIAAGLKGIEVRANRWAEASGGQAQVIDGESMVGGGSLPGGTLPTKLLAFNSEGRGKGALPVQALAVSLRRQEIPVIGRISGNRLLLDPRSVLPEEDEIVIRAIQNSIKGN